MRHVLVVSFALVLSGCGEVAPTDVIAPDSPLALSVIPGGGGSGLPFGPVVYDRAAGSPVTISAEVHFDGFQPPFRMVIENDGTYAPVSPSAVVRLGNVEVFGTDAFSAGNPVILSALVNPDADPVLSLEVELRGTPSSGFRLRIEGSGEVLAGPGGGDLDLGGGDVGLSLPAGAVQEEVVLTADPVASPPPGGVSGLPGTVFNLGPEGQQFSEPIKLTFTYDPAVLTAANPNAREEDLRLFTLVGNRWIPTANTSIDPVTKKVSGFTSHFSQFGILPLTEVCLGKYATVQEAYDATLPGGMVQVCDDQTHSVEGVVLDAPVSIIPAPGASPVLQTSTELAAFWVNGFSQGVVFMDGLTFDFDTPDGGEGARSYAVTAAGTFDQLIIRSSTFDADAGSRGSINIGASTVGTSKTLIDQVTITGGVFGVAVTDNDADVVNSDISGVGSIGVSHSALGTPGKGGTVQGSTFADCGSRCVRPTNGAVVDVVSNTFGQCGTARCISIGSAAQVQVTSNTFAAPVLTGDSGPDQNEIILYHQGTSGLVDGNTFDGCGYFSCIDATLGSSPTISNNQFAHVAGQVEDVFSSVIQIRNGASATVQNNVLSSCPVSCYEVLNGASATIQGETVSIPTGHGTQRALSSAIPDPPAGPNTITFVNNTVLGEGEANAVMLFEQADATLNGNTFSNLVDGVYVGTQSSILGSDNVFTLSGQAVSIAVGGVVDFQSNDFTGQSTDIGSFGDGTGVLTCNWWGDAAGPQNVSGAPSAMYVPWATAPIAQGAGGACDGS